MALLIRWQFDSCDFVPQEEYDKWWLDMHIDSQLRCEEALCYCGRGESLIFFKHENKVPYKIDLVRMFQQNLRTGRIRPIRRTIVYNFCLEESYFVRGRLKRRRPAEPVVETRNQKQRKLREYNKITMEYDVQWLTNELKWRPQQFHAEGLRTASCWLILCLCPHDSDRSAAGNL